MIKYIIIISLNILAFIYSKYFLAEYCREEIISFKQKFYKRFKRNPENIFLIIFICILLIFLFILKTTIKMFFINIFFIIPLISAIFVKQKNFKTILIIFFSLLIPLLDSWEIISILMILFFLIYFSLSSDFLYLKPYNYLKNKKI